MSISKIDPAGLDVGQIGGRRNLIINGAGTVAQRSTQVTGVTTSGFRTCDRFKFFVLSLGTWTVDQSTDAPDGFANSFKMTCTTAEPSPVTSDEAGISYRIEAQDLQRLNYGASSAESFTLSFYVKSNKTGTASIVVQQLDNSFKMYSTTYSISSANTWERKTITIDGDTSGVINNDNGVGFNINWWLNSGSNYTSGATRNAWTAYADGDQNASNLGVGGATSDYFAITGVQLEVGTVATPFEHRSYGEELALCQRYALVIEPDNSGCPIQGIRSRTTEIVPIEFIYFPTEMRASPSITYASGAFSVRTETNDLGSQTPTTEKATKAGFCMKVSGGSYTSGEIGVIRDNAGSAKITLDAEL